MPNASRTDRLMYAIGIVLVLIGVVLAFVLPTSPLCEPWVAEGLGC
jgi:hypothetical protein